MKTTSACDFPSLTVKITYPTGWMRFACEWAFPNWTKDDVEKMFRVLRDSSRTFGYAVSNSTVIQDLRDWLEKAEVAAGAALLRARETMAAHRVPLEGLKKRTEIYRNAKELNESLECDVKLNRHQLERIQDRRKLFEIYFGEV